MSITMPSQTGEEQTPASRSREAVQRLARDVLDRLAITDLVYHDLAFSEPLVLDLLWRILNRTPAGGRVLLVGGDLYLGAVLADQGYHLDIWALGDGPVAEELASHITGHLDARGSFGAGSSGVGPYDTIVLPLVLEHLDAHPADVLRGFRALLAPTGRLVLATTNLGRLGARTRALLGRAFLPDPRVLPPQTHGSWPRLRQYRFYAPGELAVWGGEAGYVVSDWVYSLGQTAFYQALPLRVSDYLVLKAKHVLKSLVPGLREYVVMTMQARPPEPPRAVLPALAEPDKWLPTSAGHTSLPMVTVVLPTRDRADLLRVALPALFTQTYPAERYEILVIDDGSVDRTPQVIEQLGPQAPCRFRSVRSTGIGTAAARNLGMRLAEGEVVAHVDDDCLVSSGWLEAGVLGFEQNVAVVSGPIDLAPDERLGFFDAFMIYPFDNGTYPTANVFYRRDVALAAGGFDESFGRNLMGRPVWGWDADLAWRLLRKGYEGRFRDANAYAHIFHLRPIRWLLEGWRAGSMMPMVVRAVPELRSRALVGGIFYTWCGLAFKVGLLGIVLAIVRHRPAWLLLWLSWLRWATSMSAHDRWPPHRWHRLAAKLALLFGLHVLTAAGLAYGSLRARRLVL